MPVSKTLIYVLNASLTLASLGIYWFNINLWQDQAVMIFSGLGSLSNGLFALYNGFRLLTAEKGKALSLSLGTVLFSLFFLLNMAVFLFCLWQKS